MQICFYKMLKNAFHSLSSGKLVHMRKKLLVVVFIPVIGLLFYDAHRIILQHDKVLKK